MVVIIDSGTMLFTKIELKAYDILVPFICLRCGKRCREYMPHFPEQDLMEIADFLKWPEVEVFRRYEESYRHCISSSPRPCIFLDIRNLCVIYGHPLRPVVCFLYPFSFEIQENLDCPGYDDHRRMIDTLLDDENCYSLYNSSFCPNCGHRAIPRVEWSEVRMRFRHGHPSVAMARMFLRWNTPLKSNAGAGLSS